MAGPSWGRDALAWPAEAPASTSPQLHFYQTHPGSLSLFYKTQDTFHASLSTAKEQLPRKPYLKGAPLTFETYSQHTV